MMEQLLVEYFVNSIWQVLLLTLGASILVRTLRPTPKVQYRIWIGVLPLLVLLPVASVHSGSASRPQALTPGGNPHVVLNPAIETNVEAPIQLLDDASANSTPSPLPILSKEESSLSVRHERFLWPPVRDIQLGRPTTLSVVGFYLSTIAFALIRLMFGWRTARRLIAESKPAELNRAESILLNQCCLRLNVPPPHVLESAEIRSPMVVGTLRPSLLLPAGLANRTNDSILHPGRSFEAVLLHELAHLQRRDCFANFACRIITLPVAYHPAIWAVRQRIRQTQEMLCDAIAAREMNSAVGYARALVGLALKMQNGDRQIAPVYGTTMFDGNILEERVMQLIETRKILPARTRSIRLACGAAVALSAIATAATFHLSPTMAQTSDSLASPSTATSESDAPNPSHQIEDATRQFDQAMDIVRRHLNGTASYQRAEVKKQIADARNEAQTDAHVPAEVEMLSEMAKDQAMIHNPDLQLHMAQAQAEFNSPEFKKRMADLQARFDSPEFKKRMAEMQERFNSPEFKQKLKKLNDPEFQKKIAEAQAKFNSPEFKKQIADMQAKWNTPEFKEKMKKLNSLEFQKKMAEAQAKFDSPEFKKQMAEMQAKFDSPEFKEKIKRFNSPEFQKQIAEATARVNNPEFRRQLEELNQKYKEQLDELLKQFNVPASPSSAPNTP